MAALRADWAPRRGAGPGKGSAECISRLGRAEWFGTQPAQARPPGPGIRTCRRLGGPGQAAQPHPGAVAQEEETLRWRPRSCSFRPRKAPPRPSVRRAARSGEGKRGPGRGPVSLPPVPAVVRAAAPGGPGHRRRPGRAEQPAEARAVSRHRPDLGAACGRGAGRGGLPRAGPARLLEEVPPAAQEAPEATESCECSRRESGSTADGRFDCGRLSRGASRGLERPGPGGESVREEVLAQPRLASFPSSRTRLGAARPPLSSTCCACSRGT
ncbi:hypothetical protein MC885_021352 [Smutsia gigantea]|nr:hypothetical protein MC885_021352 [Smutsia gigantea]